MLFSPALNKFVEHSSRKELAVFCVGLMLFQAYFNDFWLISPEFKAGYSILSFMNLYCIGRFLHLYKHRLFSFSKEKDLFIWLFFVCCIVLNALFNMGVTQRFYAFSYNNPLVICASAYFLLNYY